MKIMLDFKLKGQRNYIQGGDIVDHVDDYLKAQGIGRLMRIAFRSFARNGCSLHFSQPQDPSGAVADGQYQGTDGVMKPYWLVEDGQPATERYVFDEELIVGSADVVGERIKLQSLTPFSMIENIIALTKKLNYQLCPITSGKWVFGQLILLEPLPDTYTQIEIERKSLIAGRFSNNAMYIDGRHIGDMRFIVGKP
jgi:hypothetical protein